MQQQRLFEPAFVHHTWVTTLNRSSGETAMCASHAYVSFDTPTTHDRLPICNAIRGLAGMASQLAVGNGADSSPADSSVAVLVDAEVDGSRYLLVRMPRPDRPLTAQPSMHPQARPHSTKHSPADRRQNIGHFRRVLVAVDDENTRLRLLALLRTWGFDVVVPKHAVEALHIAQHGQIPDLVILGRTAAGMDSLELCRQISGRGNECSPWILMLDQPAERQDVVQALESGAADHLTLPFDEQELRARLLSAVRMLERQTSLIKSRDTFREQAMRDGLTGLWNRNAILDILRIELFRAERNHRSTGILMLDLDHFKEVNDAYGHLVGDAVLQETSRRLQSVLRAYDAFGRYGGEEFLIVVPGTDERELCELAERLRALVAAKPMLAGPYQIPITMSVGAAIASANAQSAPEVLASADAALYRAKQSGRNRIAHCTGRPFAIVGECHQPLPPKRA
jgi:two-component system, cell cycle response regulator